MKPEPNNPPVGFGPYVIKNVQNNVGFDVVRNPNYAAQAIPGIPAGHMDIHVKIESNTTTEASDVINNQADVFDWARHDPAGADPAGEQADRPLSSRTRPTRRSTGS